MAIRYFLEALAVILVDWIICGRFAALAPNIAYKYKLVSFRFIPLFIGAWLILHGDDYVTVRDTNTILSLVLIILYLSLVIRDIFSQRGDDSEDDRNPYDF